VFDLGRFGLFRLTFVLNRLSLQVENESGSSGLSMVDRFAGAALVGRNPSAASRILSLRDFQVAVDRSWVPAMILPLAHFAAASGVRCCKTDGLVDQL
jgi:hypothetical protein